MKYNYLKEKRLEVYLNYGNNSEKNLRYFFFFPNTHQMTLKMDFNLLKCKKNAKIGKIRFKNK